MARYKIKHTKEELEKINKITYNKTKIAKLQSVLSYLKKYTLEDGTLEHTVRHLYIMYKHHHYAMSQKYFYQLVQELKDWDVYSAGKRKKRVPPCKQVKLEEQENKEDDNDDNDITGGGIVEEIGETLNPIVTIENTSLEPSQKNCNNITYNNNTNNTIYTNSVKNRVLSKKELKDIAKDLMSKMNISNNDIVRKVVLNKLKHSKIQINLFGSISYINKIIQEKMIETMWDYKTAVSTFVSGCSSRNYTQEQWDDMEKQLLGY